MARYFFEIAYNGSDRSGWQKQPNALTIQEDIENLLSKLYQKDICITGCGRTDAGVHALQYIFHVDLEDSFEQSQLLYKLNRMSNQHLAFYRMKKVKDEAHARFDATSRSYVYKISLEKNPFTLTYNLPSRKNFNLDKLNTAAKILLDYDAFYPFCKSNSDVNHYNCGLTVSEWVMYDQNQIQFHIKGRRFLRGMVRLIVGMCLNYMNGLIDEQEIHKALQKQERLPKDLSVPPNGLFLDMIVYPSDIFSNKEEIES